MASYGFPGLPRGGVTGGLSHVAAGTSGSTEVGVVGKVERPGVGVRVAERRRSAAALPPEPTGVPGRRGEPGQPL
jgi:hypothetical protein